MDELEQRINHCHTKGMEDEEDYERAAKALGAAPGNKTKKSVATPGGKFTVYVQHLRHVNGNLCQAYSWNEKLKEVYE